MWREIFLGKPIHWAIWVVNLGVLYALGHNREHVRNFTWFVVALLALGAASVLFVYFTSRKGEVITRDPFEE